MSGPLHLRKGDPLPDLPLQPPLDLQALAGRWILLVFVAGEGKARCEAEFPRFSQDFGKQLTCRAIAARGFAVASRRVGALVDEDQWHELAVLLDPRGTVHASCDAEDPVAAARKALALSAT